MVAIWLVIGDHCPKPATSNNWPTARRTALHVPTLRHDIATLPGVFTIEFAAPGSCQSHAMRRDIPVCVQEHSTSDPSDYDDIDDELLALLEDDGADKVAAPPCPTERVSPPLPHTQTSKRPRREYSPVCPPSPPPPQAPRLAVGTLSALPPEVGDAVFTCVLQGNPFRLRSCSACWAFCPPRTSQPPPRPAACCAS